MFTDYKNLSGVFRFDLFRRVIEWGDCTLVTRGLCIDRLGPRFFPFCFESGVGTNDMALSLI